MDLKSHLCIFSHQGVTPTDGAAARTSPETLLSVVVMWTPPIVINGCDWSTCSAPNTSILKTMCEGKLCVANGSCHGNKIHSLAVAVGQSKQRKPQTRRLDSVSRTSAPALSRSRYLGNADEGQWLGGQTLLERHRGQRFDENHPPLLQSQRAGQRAHLLWGRRGHDGAGRAGAGDQAQVLQREVEDGWTGAVEALGLLGGEGRRGGSGSVETKAGGCDLLDWGRSGACREQHPLLVFPSISSGVTLD